MSHCREAPSMGFETLSQGVCVCVHVPACLPVCGSGGNRWEVCHVLVNKSVIVLFCPA